MPIGIVSDKDFKRELENVDTPIGVPRPTTSNSSLNRISESESNNASIETIKRGRGEGNKEVPESLRDVIGQTAVHYGRQDAIQLAKHFGLSESSASAYAVGATSTATYHDRTNGRIARSKEIISRKARSKMIMAMNALTEEKLALSSPKELSAVARDMASVHKQMEPTVIDTPKEVEKDKGPTFVFYSPQFFKEEKFDRVISPERE